MEFVNETDYDWRALRALNRAAIRLDRRWRSLLLRAMGYEDGTDFQWDSLWTLSNQPGFTDYDPAHPGAFTRGTAAV